MSAFFECGTMHGYASRQHRARKRQDHDVPRQDKLWRPIRNAGFIVKDADVQLQVDPRSRTADIQNYLADSWPVP